MNFTGERVFGRTVVVSLLLCLGTVYLAFASKTEPTPIRRSLGALPRQIGSWTEVRSDEIESKLQVVLGVDDYVNRLFLNQAGDAISLYIGYYQSQRQGDTIHSPLNCLPGAGWNPVERDTVAVSVKSEIDPIRINRIVIQKGLEKQLVFYWYQSHGRVIASEYWGKIYAVLDALRTNRTDAALIRTISRIVGTDSTAEEKAGQGAVDFVQSLFPLLAEYLPD